MTSICQIIHTLLFLYDVIVVPSLLFEGGRVVIITIETSTALIPSLCTFHLLKLWGTFTWAWRAQAEREMSSVCKWMDALGLLPPVDKLACERKRWRFFTDHSYSRLIRNGAETSRRWTFHMERFTEQCWYTTISKLGYNVEIRNSFSRNCVLRYVKKDWTAWSRVLANMFFCGLDYFMTEKDLEKDWRTFLGDKEPISSVGLTTITCWLRCWSSSLAWSDFSATRPCVW